MLQVQIAIAGQYMENYGAHDWDGKGTCPQYWKCKGEHEQIMVSNVPLWAVAEVAAEIKARMVEMSWSDEGSSCHFDSVMVIPNKISSYDLSAFQYGFYEEITSIPQEEVKAFLKAFGKGHDIPQVEDQPLPYEEYDIV